MNRTNIIGQLNLLDQIDELIEKDCFPRFCILVGTVGSGKKLVANYIADKLDCEFIPCSPKIDNVREIIDMSYTLSEPACYMWADSDLMSVGAKNALLKITEEPPEQAYFIITLTNEQQMLPTIISRGTRFYIEPYTSDNLLEFMQLRNITCNDKELALSMCSCPGELLELSTFDIDTFVAFINKVIDFIGQASCANALKLSTSFKLKKDETEKYDVKLFLKCVQAICCNRLKQSTDVKYAKLITLTCASLSEFRLISVNKQAVLDSWLLKSRTIMKE